MQERGPCSLLLPPAGVGEQVNSLEEPENMAGVAPWRHGNLQQKLEGQFAFPAVVAHLPGSPGV